MFRMMAYIDSFIYRCAWRVELILRTRGRWFVQIYSPEHNPNNLSGIYDMVDNCDSGLPPLSQSVLVSQAIPCLCVNDCRLGDFVEYTHEE